VTNDDYTHGDYKYSSNFINIGYNRRLFKLSESNTANYDGFGLLPLVWNNNQNGQAATPVPIYDMGVNGNENDEGVIVTKLIDLGSPLAKKTILGFVLNMINNTAYGGSNTTQTYAVWIMGRQARGDTWVTIGSGLNLNDGAANNTIPYSHSVTLQPPFKCDWTQMQFKIIFHTSVNSNYSINDFNVIIRTHKDSISEAAISDG
jgi:hypothetical protein